MHRRCFDVGAQPTNIALGLFVGNEDDGRQARGGRGQMFIDENELGAGIVDDIADLIARESEIDRQEDRAPRWLTAKASSTKATLFFMRTATTSPGPMDCADGQPATCRTRALKAA